MRTSLTLTLILFGHAVGWCAVPDLSPVPDGSAVERLLVTPAAVIRFGWRTEDPSVLLDRIQADSRPTVVRSPIDGILEYVCSPDSILLWGTPLFRVYELDLLADLRAAEEAAARLGDHPFVVAPRHRARSWSSASPFPSPVRQSRALPPPPPPIAQPLIRVERTPASVPPPTVTRPAPAMVAIPAPTPEPVPAKPDPARIEAATARLAEIDERISSLTAAIAASKAELATAQSAATPLRDDVDARRRLFESGIIAGNAVKAAEQELATAEAAVTAAQAQVTEAESALGTAESDRDAALSGLEAAKTPIEQPAAAPAVVTVEPVVTSVPVPEPGPSPITAPPPPVPDPEPVDLFPAPSVGPALAELAEPPPMLNPPVRLDRGRDLPDAQRLPVLPLPTGADDLARRRWEDAEAPWQCVVSQALTPRGARVAEGTPVMELRRTSVARLHAVVAEDYVGFCRVGAPIEVAFPSHGVAYRGWISAVEATHAPDAPGARIEVFLARGTAGQSTVYSDIEWIALTTPAIGDTEPLTYEPPVRPTRVGDPSRFFPLGLEQSIPSRQHPPADGQLTGRLELVSSKRPSGFASGDPVAEEKLDRLVDWRESFVEGMRTTVFPETDLTLTYPRTGDSARAVERMATRRVSHRPNLCAGTMRQALGWGLGDAAAWARRLPERGYKLREDGVARPGDILVWPFTYGPSRSQHIGIAVGQGGTVMLLSNEGGVLGTTRLKPHYLAFHKPETLARAGDETPTDG